MKQNSIFIRKNLSNPATNKLKIESLNGFGILSDEISFTLLDAGGRILGELFFRNPDHGRLIVLISLPVFIFIPSDLLSMDFKAAI